MLRVVNWLRLEASPLRFSAFLPVSTLRPRIERPRYLLLSRPEKDRFPRLRTEFPVRRVAPLAAVRWLLFTLKIKRAVAHDALTAADNYQKDHRPLAGLP